MPPKTFRLSEIAVHDKEDDLWFIIDAKVYDVSKFAAEHPGGPGPLLSAAGDDASNGFKSNGHSDSAKEDLKAYYIGDVHPDDVGKLKAPIQGTQGSPIAIALVAVLILLTAYCLWRSM